MAELLVRAMGHELDKLSSADVEKMDAKTKAQYEARTQKGDVIVVKPDGWQWGKCECLPEYIIVKVAGTEAENKYLEESLIEYKFDADWNRDMPVLLRKRKNYIDAKSVDKIADAVKDFEEITPFELTKDEPISEKVKQ
jgi:hypothetical protein